MSEKLKPCPFCGSTVEFRDMNRGPGMRVAACDIKIFCPGCEVPFNSNERSQIKMLRHWNTRAEIPKAWWDRLRESLILRLQRQERYNLQYVLDKMTALESGAIDRIERGE